MFINNFDPVAFEILSLEIRWYSLAYIIGIILGWVYCKKKLIKDPHILSLFDDFITYLIIGVIIGGRLGYALFYNLKYYLENPFEILMLWNGGMSFHGALIGIVIGTYLFSIKRKISLFFLLDVIACVSPIGIFFGRIANFINGELVGKVTNASWGIIFPAVDALPRHPSQLYEALLEGIILFFILNIFIFKKKYKIGTCSFLFLIFYGCFRIFSELFREPDLQIGYLLNLFSMGTILSSLMIFVGIIIFISIRKK